MKQKMKLIKLPVMWFIEDESKEKLIEMGLYSEPVDEDFELGHAYINPEFISHINRCDGYTNIWVSGDVFKCPLSENEVIELINKI